jgi:protein ImuB
MAVLGNDRVVAMTEPAADMGVRAGMRPRSAQAIAPQVALVRRDTEREAQAFRSAAVALLQYTPEVAQLEEGVILLNIGASIRAFGGVRALYRQVRQTVRGLGLDARIAMAPTAMGAWLLARQGVARGRRVLTMPALARRLDTLPCETLPAARAHLTWLRGIGCRTLGGLLRLPRAGLQRRTSTQLLQSLDKAYGQAHESFVWTTPPAVFDRRLPMPERTGHVELGILAAEHLVEQMCGWLKARHRAVCSMVFQLEHEHGRHAMPPTELRVRLAGPAWRPEHVLRLLKERLARTVLPAPFLAIRLTAEGTAPWSPPTESLFADPADACVQERLLELLVVRLGRNQVLQAAPVADHRPEVASTWRPAGQGMAKGGACLPAAWGGQAATTACLRPFWLLEQPMPLAMQNDCPAYGRDGSVSALRLVSGPERIEAGWWSGRIMARDYFIAEDSRFARYWIYRERDTQSVRWFLHGMFA